jgi:hypothetical protein
VKEHTRRGLKSWMGREWVQDFVCVYGVHGERKRGKAGGEIDDIKGVTER